jgi:DNA-binding NarL/FixJ family response regulator
MGVVSHRAGTGRQATAVMQSTPIHIAIVDLGLPLDTSSTPEQSEEGGTRVLELLARLDQPPPTVVVKRTRSMRDDRRELAAALRMGAFAVIDPPRETSDLDLLLDVMRRVLTRHYKGRWPA